LTATAILDATVARLQFDVGRIVQSWGQADVRRWRSPTSSVGPTPRFSPKSWRRVSQSRCDVSCGGV
jgi:hypothetical protein